MKWTDLYLVYVSDGNGGVVCEIPKGLPEYVIEIPGENAKPVKVEVGDKIHCDVGGNVTIEHKKKEVKKDAGDGKKAKEREV